MTVGSVWMWAGFVLFVLAMLAIDLGVFQRKAHVVSTWEAGIWTAVWIGLALLFGLGLYFLQGAATSLEFLTGYLIEKALSVDNIFVFVLICSFFAVTRDPFLVFTSNVFAAEKSISPGRRPPPVHGGTSIGGHGHCDGGRR